jgi:N-acetylglucosaminyldiphosphoundecaprenol N-acetyl-beta-D-mannosaminyltransferase
LLPVIATSSLQGARVRVGELWIDALTFDEALDEIERLVGQGRGGSVFTPNVDHVVNVERDAALRAAYESVDLSLADGQPVVWASRLLRTPVPEKISGSDLVPRLLERARKRRFRVYILGGAQGVAERVSARLLAEGIVVAGAEGPFVGLEAAADEPALVARVHAARADLVLVGLGSPKQERFIHRTRGALAPAVLLGIGASLDFLAGTAKRSPRWMSNAGLEWLYRLVHEPRRLARRYLLNDPLFALVVWRMLRTPREARFRLR